jgi:hypothetical protein
VVTVTPLGEGAMPVTGSDSLVSIPRASLVTGLPVVPWI